MVAFLGASYVVRKENLIVSWPLLWIQSHATVPWRPCETQQICEYFKANTNLTPINFQQQYGERGNGVPFLNMFLQTL